MNTRLEIATALKRMAVSYWVHKKYGTFLEVGVERWGRRRADVVAMNLRGEIVICEVKSGLADFRTDLKHHEYLPYCNRMYFIFPHPMDVELPDGVGIMVPSATGYLRVLRPARKREMQGKIKRDIITRLAWRAATYSKRNTPRRTKIFLDKS